MHPPNERSPDATAARLRSDRDRRDATRLHLRAAEPRLERETRAVRDDFAVQLRDDDVVEGPEGMGDEVPLPVVVATRIGERRKVDLEESSDVAFGCRTELRLLRSDLRKLGHSDPRMLRAKACSLNTRP